MDTDDIAMTQAGAGAAESIETAAIDWVRRNFEHFKPQSHRDPKRSAFVTKAAAELALLCGLAASSSAGIATPYQELAARVWEEIFTDEAVQDYMLGSPGEVPCVGFYASMRQCGFEDLRYRRRLTAILDGGYLHAVERPPSNDLDFLFSLRHAGLATGPDEPAYRRSLLAHHPPIHAVTTEDVYTMTHVIFFTTQFGRSAPGFFTDADRRYFDRALPLLTGYYIRRFDWDLTAELVIALHAVGLHPPVFNAAWKLLARAQQPDGSFTGPAEGKPSGSEASPDDHRQWIAFRDDYHTTLAVLLAMLTAPPK